MATPIVPPYGALSDVADAVWLPGLAAAFCGMAGAALARLGYLLVHSALGVEAVHGAAPEYRGLVMGVYAACLDLAFGFGSPVLGWASGRTKLDTVLAVNAADRRPNPERGKVR